MINTKNGNIRAGFWYTISNFLVKGASFLATPIILRLVTQEAYGEYVNFNSWLSILMIVATGYLSNSILCAQFDFEKEIRTYVKTITVLSSCLVLGVFGVVCLFREQISSFLVLDFSYICIMFLYLLVDSAYQNLITYDRMKLSYKRVIVCSMLLTLLPLVGSIAGVFFVQNHLAGLLLGKMLPMILICMGIYFYIIRDKGKIKKAYMTYALRISLPYIPHALSNMLLITSDRIIIQQLCGPGEVALYSVVYTCSMVVSLVYNALSQAWSPWLLKKLDEKDYLSIRKYAKPYFGLFVVFAALAMLAAPELLWIVGGKTYVSVVTLIPPIMTGIVIQYYYSYFVNIEFYHKKTFWISVNTMTATIINIGLNYLLIPRFGIVVAAYTTLFGYLCLLVLHFLGAKRLKLANIYDNKWNVLILGLYIVLMILCVGFLYEYIVIRYTLAVIIMLVVVWGLAKGKIGVKH